MTTNVYVSFIPRLAAPKEAVVSVKDFKAMQNDPDIDILCYVRLTFRGVREALKELGMTLRHDASYGEYRVAFRGEPDMYAYYTNSIDDAYNTALKMHYDRVVLGE